MKITIIKNGEYIVDEQIKYYSERYKKYITVPKGFKSDGATMAIDIVSLGWVVHDRICEVPFFDDGTSISAWKAANILSDILKQEKRWFRSFSWKYTTFLFGCKKSRLNGWF